MRIGVNGLLLAGRGGYRQTGVSRYVDRLVAALPAAMPEADFLVYTGRDVELPTGRRVHKTMLPVVNPAVRILWERLALPVRSRVDRLSLFHGTVNTLPAGLGCRSVVTIHDLALLRWPEQVTARRYHYLSRAMRDAARRADRVLAVSEATRNDIVELLNISPDKIAVTPLGVDERFTPPPADAVAAFKTRMGIDRPFVLTVGTLEPRKNLPRLLEAFSRVKNDMPHQLVLVGPEGWRTGPLQTAIAQFKLEDRLRVTGFVPDDDLALWYAAAELFVLPSLYEGFGLPIVEAMACGAAVLTSNVSSMPEVAGDAALFVDPNSVDSIEDGLRQVLTGDELRRGLKTKGLARARAFTWQQTAATTVAAYREVLR